ncbi:MAG: recombinase RecT, partial [Ectopseudomonas guguanensis]|uniref:recombinase RecT n=1 Tax=Ectopseudomonas guguanensis TaxID=1198456 RepID=UPI003918B0C6
DESLSHRPAEDGSEGDITHVYAVARLKDGGRQFEVMSKAQVIAVQNQSKAGKSGPWVSHWEEMAKKTVIRRLFKYLPVSVEIQRAVMLDEKAEAGANQDHEYVLDGEFELVDGEEQQQP